MYLLSQGLLTWTLLLAALIAPGSFLSPVNGTDGGSVYLSGNLPLPARRQVTWRFSGTQIVTQYQNIAPDYTAQYEGRCELFPNTTLRLDNLTMLDQGNYTITIQDLSSAKPPEEQTIELRIYRSLTTPTLTSYIIRPVNGSNMILRCDDHSQTVTSYSFYRNQQDVCSHKHVNCSGSDLIFQPILESDAGSYTCTIHNPISSNSSKALDLQVSAPGSSLSPVNGTDGGSVYLSGNLPLPARRQVTWRFNSAQIVTQFQNIAPVYTAQYEGRCELFLDTTLRLDNLNMADQGNYTITIQDLSSTKPPEEQTIELRIYRPLTTPTLNSIASRPFNGSDFTLRCDAHNQTVTSYSFYRNQQDVCSHKHVNCSGSDLIFQPILESDAGSYTCTIHNPISSNRSKALDLQVSVRVSEVKIQSNSSAILWVGRDSVSLTCSSLGTDVQFSWNLNGNKLPSNPRYSLHQNNSILIVSPVDRSDNGSFTCTASNWINNKTSVPFKLNLGLPVSEVKIQSNTSSSDVLWAGNNSVSLNCLADGTAAHFSWNLNSAPLSSGGRYHLNQDNSTLTISPLDKKDNGIFTCTATNVLNNMTSNSLKLNLNWHPDGDITCFANGTDQTVNLFCSWPGGFPAAVITMTFKSNIETGQDQVIKSVSLNSIVSNDKMDCHGSQGGLEKSCALSLGNPQAAGFANYSATKVEEGATATLTVALTSNSVVVNSRVLEPVTQILPATFKWFYFRSNSTPLPSGEKFKVTSNDSSSTLTVNSVTEKENGTYECKATNLIGSTSFLFLLNVQSKEDGLSPGEIAGIVIGVLASLVIVGIAVFYVLKRKKHSPKPNTYENPGNQMFHVYERKMPEAEKEQNSKEEPTYEGLIVPNNDLYSNLVTGPKT